ncbi:MAG: DUF3306 domain-containing protein [Pseudolabrys sp.]
MSAPEDFLARWSRRKRDAAGEGGAVEQPVAGDTPAMGGDASKKRAAVSAQEPGVPPEPAFDLASLPPIDSIGAASDVTAFLREGVPVELARAALRRAWGADPAIRDFVGLAENAWDFNDPTAMPGFGSLDQSPEQVRQMLADLFGETQRMAEKITDISGDLPSEPARANDSSDLEPPAPVIISDEFQNGEASLSHSAPAINERQPDIATQQNEKPEPAQPRRRTHGGALPQ